MTVHKERLRASFIRVFSWSRVGANRGTRPTLMPEEPDFSGEKTVPVPLSRIFWYTMHMNTTTQIPDPGIPENAVSVYGQDSALDDFPVLKAFQQYIDSEQAKARKRMLMLCTFFAFLMIVVMAVFVALLVSVSSRNQSLNDRLVEFAMKERDRPSTSPVVVQPPQE